MPLGTIVAQTIHAAGESSPGQLPENTYAVALAAENEEDLLVLEFKLKRAGIPHKTIREPDEPYLGAAMAIGIVPCGRSTVRKLLSRFPLIK